MKFKRFINEGKNTKQSAKEVAEQIIDEIPYKVKEYFGGWPEDVIGRSAQKEFYNLLYKEIIKMVKNK